MTREARGNLRYRAKATTALATIALAAGGYLVMSGSTTRPAAAAGNQKVTIQLSSESDAGQLDLWSKLPAPEAEADAGANEGEAAGYWSAEQGQPQPQGTVSISLPRQEAVPAAGAPQPPLAAARREIPIQEDVAQPLPAAMAAAIPIQDGGSKEDGLFSRAWSLVSDFIGPDEESAEGTYRAALPAGDGRSQQLGSSQFAAVPFGDDSGRADSSRFAVQTAAGKPIETSNGVAVVSDEVEDDPFRSGPSYENKYNADGQVDIYGGKSAVEPPRPPIEIGRQQYTEGEYDESNTALGEKNPLLPGLAIYGDWRTAVAYNDNQGQDLSQVATRLNIDIDFKITGTERLHAFFTPLQDGAEFTRFEFAGKGADKKLNKEFDFEPQRLFFEGDVGSIYAGVTDQYADFDLPFTVGLFPLFLQNGTWANDDILGGAVTLPALNSASLGLANFDVTFFAAGNDVTNPGVIGPNGKLENNNVNAYGATTFIDAFGGYIEAGYGLLQGYDDQDGLFAHFLTAAYSRRWANTVSNSTRVFWNFTNLGDIKLGGDNDQNVDGFALISENSLITGLPSTLLPYANFFFGHNAPQPLVNADGLMKNVGINFETDALTGFPALDASGSNAVGGAIGLQYLFNLDQQLVFEMATVQPYDDAVTGTTDPQYGFGVRYQLPITRAWLIRADATYQLLEGLDDSMGVRFEVRRKF